MWITVDWIVGAEGSSIVEPSLRSFAKLALHGFIYTTLFTPKSQSLKDFSANVSAYNEKYFGVNMTGWYTSSYTEPLYDAGLMLFFSWSLHKLDF